ncbi:DB module family protein [Loa loa]|uniref:DB module family protein n=1 Tax=Loa loa TaxID=7209 RepID=A0A1S0TQA6_LOALO|nr:DB module family protein [Loa loa]EFO18253.1 DB module family protein [Loa loa]
MRYCLRCILYILTILHAVIIADDANSKFKKCCKAYKPLLHNETAVNECLNKYCDFDTISQTNVLVFLKHCDGTVVGNMFSCASSNYDHTQCCLDNGVSGKCLEYCSAQDGVPPNYLDYLTCLDYFDTIKQCFRNYLEKNPAIKS